MSVAKCRERVASKKEASMTPTEYAARYLPVQVPGPAEAYPIHVRRYRLGDPKPSKDALLGAVAGHLAIEQKKNKAYRLSFLLNGQTYSVANWHEIGLAIQRPFIGKGSPEDCQLVLQLAYRVGNIRPENLQTWADDNIGLDCNGFVGNYIYHHLLEKPWDAKPAKGDPEPSAVITTIFNWAAGVNGLNALADLDKVTPGKKYLIVRVDAAGRVMPGGPGNPVGHIAITEPNKFMKQSFVNNSMGGIDMQFVQLDMYNHFALQTAESAGPVNGVGNNWMVFIRKHKTLPKVFEVRRDKIHKLDTVKIAEISKF
jgi:hypothetical protein